MESERRRKLINRRRYREKAEGAGAAWGRSRQDGRWEKKKREGEKDGVR